MDLSDRTCALDAQDYRLVLRNDFHSFLHRSFAELNPRTPFLDNWHLAVLAAKLENVRLGKTRRLIVNLPPRHLKSHAASIAFPAWLMGHDPSTQILCVSYGQELSDKLSRDCRALMTSRFYETLFPTRLSPMRSAVEEFATTAHGFRLATSVGGVVTGRGGDTIIVDDPLKPEEAVSETFRKRVNDWYDNTLYSRLNDRRKGAIVIIMQRLHEDDLVGHVREQEDWEVVSFPAIAERDESFTVETRTGTRSFGRKAGEALHADREPLEELDKIRRALGSYNFAGQYQQLPAPAGGGMVRREWFRFYDAPLGPFDRVLQSWDTANKATELADFSVCTTWGAKGKNFYLLDVFRRKLNYPELKRAVRAQAERFGATRVLIEDCASGTQLIQELLGEGLEVVKKVTPEGDKIMRLHAQTAKIEEGRVHLPRSAPWLEDYLAELVVFPRGRYDDQVDSTAQALASLPTEDNLELIRAWARVTLHLDDATMSMVAHQLGEHLKPRLMVVEETMQGENGESIARPVPRLLYADGRPVVR
ncbi:MAG TPA: phage terminase large subunit [Rhizomicrobium sp.]|jgi:predicted phage terminase large subunit-like protein|nr:phage terminase large subunit [Rhizomicrobium sp.]